MGETCMIEIGITKTFGFALYLRRWGRLWSINLHTTFLSLTINLKGKTGAGKYLDFWNEFKKNNDSN